MLGEGEVVTDAETGKTYSAEELRLPENEDLALALYNQLFESFQNLLTNKDALISAEDAAAIAGKTGDEVRLEGQSETRQEAASLNDAAEAGLDTNVTKEYASQI
jgi:hypothetical protein